MAGVSSFNQFSCNCKALSVRPPLNQFSSNPALIPANSICFVAEKAAAMAERSKFSITARPVLSVRAVSEDELRPGTMVAVVEEEPRKEPTEIDLLKKQLVDSFYGTDRGVRATSETRVEIVELITQLEAKNPTPAPMEALTLLNGKWILGYISFAGLFPLLSRMPPLVKVDISQIIESKNFTVQETILFSGPLASIFITANAKFEVRSSKRVQIKFVEGIIGTPQLTDSIVVPENVEVLGQNFDLLPFKGLITCVQGTASSVAKSISSQPPLKFDVSTTNVESWILTTYIDEELRVSRGDAGSIFVFIKEGSSLLTP